MLCSEAVEAWDKDGDVAPVIEKMKLYLAVAPRKTRKPRRSTTSALPLLPGFAEPYREKLQSWWELRRLQHAAKAKDSLSARTIAALESANELGVLEEFCDLASESSWLSLGFPGYTEMLEKLAQDKKFKTGARQMKKDGQEQNLNNPSYKPLVIDKNSDVFF